MAQGGTIPVSNQTVNESQINGVAPLMGNGVSGTGSQRVNIASDNSPVAGLGAGVTGSAAPVNAINIAGGNVLNGNLTNISVATWGAGDAIGSGAAGLFVYAPYFNGSTIDRQRGNWNTNTGDTGAKTASFAGATQTNYNHRGVSIVINMGTVTGTSPTFTAQVQGSADGGTTWYSIPGAVTASITTTGVTPLTVYPGATVAANASISYPLPRIWRLNYTIGGTTPSFTITNIQTAYIL